MHSPPPREPITGSLSQVDWRRELLPFNKANVGSIFGSWRFWGIAILGSAPIAINAFQDQAAQLFFLAVYFAIGWGVVLKTYVIRDYQSWVVPIAAMLGTALLLVPLFILFSVVFAAVAFDPTTISGSPNPIVSLVGNLFLVALPEELLKAIPLGIATAIGLSGCFGKTFSIRLVTIAAFSGLGFAAMENLGYQAVSLFDAANLHTEGDAAAAAQLTAMSMVSIIVRSISLVFAHALFSALFGCSVARSVNYPRRALVLLPVGLITAVMSHGVYNWLVNFQPGYAALLLPAIAHEFRTPAEEPVTPRGPRREGTRIRRA